MDAIVVYYSPTYFWDKKRGNPEIPTDLCKTFWRERRYYIAKMQAAEAHHRANGRHVKTLQEIINNGRHYYTDLLAEHQPPPPPVVPPPVISPAVIPPQIRHNINWVYIFD